MKPSLQVRTARPQRNVSPNGAPLSTGTRSPPMLDFSGVIEVDTQEQQMEAAKAIAKNASELSEIIK